MEMMVNGSSLTAPARPHKQSAHGPVPQFGWPRYATSVDALPSIVDGLGGAAVAAVGIYFAALLWRLGNTPSLLAPWDGHLSSSSSGIALAGLSLAWAVYRHNRVLRRYLQGAMGSPRGGGGSCAVLRRGGGQRAPQRQRFSSR